MLNYEVFDKENQPTDAEIRSFLESEAAALFAELDLHVRENYKINPKFSYSSCAMDQNIWRGWNIKYQRSGKSLCTVYPQQGYFLVLVPGESFEVRQEDTIAEVIFAIKARYDEITSKKKT